MASDPFPLLTARLHELAATIDGRLDAAADQVTQTATTLDRVIRVNAVRYGFLPANSAATNLAAITDAITSNAGSSHPVVIDIPPDTYYSDHIPISTANIRIDAHGSTFVGTRLSVAPAAVGFRMKNARFYHDTASAIITINSGGGGLRDVTLVKYGAGDGYMLMSGGGSANRNVFAGIRFEGGNGAFIEGEQIQIIDWHGVGRTVGGDDFIVLKARGRRTGDININGVYAENYSNVVAIGSEIGTLAADSATRAGRVENVLGRGLIAKKCAYGVYIKPGAIHNAEAPAAYDWRDGLVRGVDMEIKASDLTGEKMHRPLVISPARNALVEHCTIRVHGEGRFTSEADSCWAYVYLPDSTAYTGATGTGGIVRDVKIIVERGADSYSGAANSVSEPGYPPAIGINVSKQNSAVGAIERLTIKANVNGTKGSGINIGPGFGAGEIKIEDFEGRNLCVNPLSSTNGGIATQSVIRAPGENHIHMASDSYKPIYRSGSGDVIGKRMTFHVNAPAATARLMPRQLPYAVWLRKVDGVSSASVGVSATNYLTLEFRVMAGTRYDGSAPTTAAFGIFTTSTTALTANTVYNHGALGTSGASFDNRFLSADAIIRLQKADTGGGAAYEGSVDLHYVQIGKRV